MTQSTLGFEIRREDAVAVITFNRPDKLNALTAWMVRQLCRALDEIEADDRVRAIVFTGSGRAFCAGADLSGGAETFHQDRPGHGGRRGSQDEPVPEDPETAPVADPARDLGGVLALRLFAATRPLIAAVNGDAVGLGATMTLPMDVRVAADSSRFGFVFTRIGIVPEACSSWFLPRVVGVNRAVEWTMGGRLVPALEALAAGLVREVVPSEEVLDTALAHARTLGEGGAPVSVAATRQMMWQGLTQAHPMEAHRVESDLVRALGAGPDAAEGIQAFVEKRDPDFPTTVAEGLPQFRHWWPEPEFDDGC